MATAASGVVSLRKRSGEAQVSCNGQSDGNPMFLDQKSFADLIQF